MPNSKDPESWGELVAGYRDTYGSRSYGHIGAGAAGAAPVRRLSATGPFLSDLAGINTTRNRSDENRGKDDISRERYKRHGWGQSELLHFEHKNTVESNVKVGRKLVPGVGPGAGANRPPAPNVSSRKDLFGIIQGKEGELTDGWIGNALIDPNKGKAIIDNASQAPKTEGDGWIGNTQINPLKGKKPTPGPETRTARKDLFEVINGDGSSGNTSIQDSWIGNIQIDPTKGKGGKRPDEQSNLFGVMKHQYLYDKPSRVVETATQQTSSSDGMTGLQLPGFKNEVPGKKFGKRMETEFGSNRAQASAQGHGTGTKNLPVPGSTTGSDQSCPQQLFWHEDRHKASQRIKGDGYTLFR